MAGMFLNLAGSFACGAYKQNGQNSNIDAAECTLNRLFRYLEQLITMKIPASHDLLLPFYFLTAWSEYTPTASVHLRLAAFVYLFSLYPGLFDDKLVDVISIDRKNVAVEYDEACFEAFGDLSQPALVGRDGRGPGSV